MEVRTYKPRPNPQQRYQIRAAAWLGVFALVWCWSWGLLPRLSHVMPYRVVLTLLGVACVIPLVCLVWAVVMWGKSLHVHYRRQLEVYRTYFVIDDHTVRWDACSRIIVGGETPYDVIVAPRPHDGYTRQELELAHSYYGFSVDNEPCGDDHCPSVSDDSNSGPRIRRWMRRYSGGCFGRRRRAKRARAFSGRDVGMGVGIEPVCRGDVGVLYRVGDLYGDEKGLRFVTALSYAAPLHRNVDVEISDTTHDVLPHCTVDMESYTQGAKDLVSQWNATHDDDHFIDLDDDFAAVTSEK